ncbi:glycosyltransferase family 4 protein [Aquirhabdus sp.]|uniref:glycosyltransferase family 4 protein n=1 Tax=Aquirhabdus sp. TaxID=2824160 RepID=UPI00396C308D
MKIIQLVPALNSGGVERGTLEVARALVAAGHESVVISSGGRMVAQLEAEGTRHITLPIHRKALSSLWQIRPLRKIILREQADILHVRSRIPAWLTHFALRKIPKPEKPVLISTVHGFYSVNRYSEIMTRADRVIAVSDSVVEYIRENYPACPIDKVTRIYRGITPEEFPHNYQPSQLWWQKTLHDFPELEHKVWLTLPGRITRLKGHETLLQLIAQLKDRFPVHGVIVGDAHEKKQAYLAELHARVDQLGLSNHVTFVGHRNDIREWLAASDIVLSLSAQAETFGRTTLEALSVGTSAVGWNRGGVAEILKACYPQGLVEAENETALFNTVQSLLTTPLAPLPVTIFQLSQMTEQTIALYAEMVRLK